MSMMGEQAARAEAGVVGLETALERTERALRAAERVDRAATEAGKGRSGRFLKFVLLLTIVGVAVIIVRKLVAGDPGPAATPFEDTSPTPDPVRRSDPSSNGDSPTDADRERASGPSA